MKKIIVANWKMNPRKLSEARRLIAAVNKVKTKNKVVICAPFVYLPLIKTNLTLGVQDIFWRETGPFTGQISVPMVRQFKAAYAIVGHSERRSLGETDAEINAKIKAVLAGRMIPILCVGHGLQAIDSEDEVLMHIQDQLRADLLDIDAKKVIVAYEPVWAIGTGRIPSPEHAEKVAMFMRIKFKVKKALYGGSTNADNSGLFLNKDIDGLLVGGSSLRPAEFAKMIRL